MVWTSLEKYFRKVFSLDSLLFIINNLIKICICCIWDWDHFRKLNLSFEVSARSFIVFSIFLLIALVILLLLPTIFFFAYVFSSLRAAGSMLDQSNTIFAEFLLIILIFVAFLLLLYSLGFLFVLHDNNNYNEKIIESIIKLGLFGFDESC